MVMPNSTLSAHKRPSRLWWLLALICLLLCLVIQIPARFLLQKFLPNQQYIDAISGNVWAGQAQWHMPALNRTEPDVQGLTQWQFKPLNVFKGRLSVYTDTTSGDSHITGQVGQNLAGTRFLTDMNGRIASSTLKQWVPGQLPDSPLQINGLNLIQTNNKQWDTVTGQLTWGGGVLGYPFDGKVEHATLPPLVGQLNLDKNRLHLALTDANHARMGDFYLAPDNMLDIQLTQRLLLNVEGYHGQAGLDTAVVSLRQPLATFGKSL